MLCSKVYFCIFVLYAQFVLGRSHILFLQYHNSGTTMGSELIFGMAVIEG